jgi:hypothetical protein
MKIQEQNSQSLDSILKKAFSDAGTFQKPDSMSQVSQAISQVTNEEETGEEKIIKRKFKKGDITDILSTKKGKMDKPIGKIFSMGKSNESETKEATASGASGGYSMPLFSETKKEMTEKWTQKYKDSIDCNNPKGFSQIAHCQGKKKKQQTNEAEFKAPKLTMFSDEAPKKIKPKKEVEKVEAKEATGAASAGAYVTPAAWAKSTSSKDWRGKSKTQIPGGAFVQVKKKCKTFPYCNQGDINALKFTKSKNKKMNESDIIIKQLSENHGIDESIIRKIIESEFGNKK